MTEKFLAIFFSVAIFAQAYLVRSIVGTWLFPACLFGLFWFALTFIPLVILFSIPIEWMAVAYIFVCSFLFSATALIANWGKAYDRNRRISGENGVNLGSPFMAFAFYSTTFFAILTLMINTVIQGYTFSDIVFDIIKTSASYIDKRYSDSLDVNIYGRLSVVFTYVSAILGGMFYHERPKNVRGSIVLLLVLIPSAAVMAIQGAKGTLFLVLAYFFSGVFVAKIKKDDLTLIGRGNISTSLLYLLIILPILVISFLARGLYEEDDLSIVLTVLTKNFLSYSSSHLYAFADWFSHLIYGKSVMNYSDDFSEYGFHTFMSVFRLMGNDKYVPPGYYEEYFFHGDIIQSNIYTVFRGLIYDFGLLGSLAFMIFFGLLSHAAFFQLLTSRRPIVSVSIFTHFVGYTYTSFIISQFVWNSIYASFFVLIMILFINSLAGKRIGRGASTPGGLVTLKFSS